MSEKTIESVETEARQAVEHYKRRYIEELQRRQALEERFRQLRELLGIRDCRCDE